MMSYYILCRLEKVIRPVHNAEYRERHREQHSRILLHLAGVEFHVTRRRQRFGERAEPAFLRRRTRSSVWYRRDIRNISIADFNFHVTTSVALVELAHVGQDARLEDQTSESVQSRSKVAGDFLQNLVDVGSSPCPPAPMQCWITVRQEVSILTTLYDVWGGGGGDG